MKHLKTLVLLGSTREGRYGDKPAHWIRDKLAAHADVDAELVDLRDWPLPFFDSALPPVRVTNGEYGNELANAWGRKIASADAYVMTVAEYNHGYTAVLKNAIDWLFREWTRKPVSFVGYGGVGGARAVEQLRQVAIELEMAPIRRAVHVPLDVYLATRGEQAPADPKLFAAADGNADLMIDELVWWAKALKHARAA